jgi:hypothetical protein
MLKTRSDWEEVHSGALGGFATLVHRMSVPGGWIYFNSVIRTRFFGRDQFFGSTVFVPDPKSQG